MATIEQELAGMAVEAPEGLADKVFTRWVTAPSRLGEVHVAFTGAGVQFVRGDADDDEFAAAYGDRFARPLRRATRGPAGLAAALRDPVPGLTRSAGSTAGGGARPGGRTPKGATDGGVPGDPGSGDDGSGGAVPEPTDGWAGRGPALDLGELRPFERAVLEATRRIPAGEVRPYAWVAREAGSPAAVRAVGTALARNPVPLLIPCHRVVRSDGAPGQYMYGTDRKLELLSAEGLDVGALEGVPFLGSDTTGVVCFPSCRHARRITDAHRRPFRRVEAALEQGYRPCRDCRPA